MLGEIARFYLEGGFFMHPIMLFGLAGLATPVMQVILARRVNLSGILVGGPTVTLLFGLMGTGMGLIKTLDAVVAADADMKTMLMVMGAAVSLNAVVLALFFVTLHALLGGIALTLRANLGRTNGVRAST